MRQRWQNMNVCAVLYVSLGLLLPMSWAGEAPIKGPGLPTKPAQFTYSVLETFPHDTSSFTQGLVIAGGTLYEGTGLRGSSTLRRVDLATGLVLQSISLGDQYFGEGIAVYDDKIIRLTWTSHIGFVYDRDSFQLLDTFTYPTEGWGITYDGQQLIMSDGTPTLHFLNPDTFAKTRSVAVHDGNTPVTRLNELEYINGQVYANVWLTDNIVRIDPVSGRVTGWIDLSGILGPNPGPSVDVLNGIAYDSVSGRLYVTGKFWPNLFRIRLLSVNNGVHSADQDGDFDISLSEVLRVVQLYNSGGYACGDRDVPREDGYLPGAGVGNPCAPHASDYTTQDWQIGLPELLRLVQLFKSNGYHMCPEGEDGFCPGRT